MADFKLLRHTHSAVKLDRLLADGASGLADLRLRHRGKLRYVGATLRQRSIQGICDCDRLLLRNEHIDHAMLEHLEGTKRNAELLTRFRVFQRSLVQFADGSYCLGALSGDRPSPAVL